MFAYRELVGRGVPKSHFGIPNLLVATITTSETHKANMLIAFRKMTSESPLFLFKAVGNITNPMPTILTDPWERVGCLPLAIACP